MPDIKEKLVELLEEIPHPQRLYPDLYVDRLIAHGVTIQTQNHIREVTKMVGWISVEERLPEYGEKVLVCDTREDYVGVSVLQKGFDFGGEKDPDYWCWCDDCFNFDEFTHWMPMPEAPKGE